MLKNVSQVEKQVLVVAHGCCSDRRHRDPGVDVLQITLSEISVSWYYQCAGATRSGPGCVLNFEVKLILSNSNFINREHAFRLF